MFRQASSGMLYVDCWPNNLAFTESCSSTTKSAAHLCFLEPNRKHSIHNYLFLFVVFPRTMELWIALERYPADLQLNKFPGKVRFPVSSNRPPPLVLLLSKLVRSSEWWPAGALFLDCVASHDFWKHVPTNRLLHYPSPAVWTVWTNIKHWPLIWPLRRRAETTNKLTKHVDLKLFVKRNFFLLQIGEKFEGPVAGISLLLAATALKRKLDVDWAQWHNNSKGYNIR